MPRKTTATAPTDAHDLTGFRLPPVYEWVECERDDINEGLPEPLKIQVLVNPPRAEIIAMSRALRSGSRWWSGRRPRAAPGWSG
jgi:hypothetical protein